jgi:SAM-dependent methyltransferase
MVNDQVQHKNDRVRLTAVHCPLCGADNWSELFIGPDRLHNVPGLYRLVRCHQCAFIYQNPRPTEDSFAAIYPTDYEPYQFITFDPTHIHNDLINTCQLIKQLQPSGGQLVDIGCGPGIFLQALHTLNPNWQLVGVEPDPHSANIARQAGLTIQQCRIEEATLAYGQLDAVTLWYVIEHVPDPVGVLRNAARLLKPDGLLYLSLPMCDSWEARLFGRYWAGWDLPRHFSAFDIKSLRAVLAKAGFTPVVETCINGTSYGFLTSLRLALQARARSYTTRRLGEALSYSRLTQAAALPYGWLSARFRRNTVLTVVARQIHPPVFH